MTGPRVALVVRQDDLHGTQRLLAAAAAHGVPLEAVAPQALPAPGEPGAPALACTRLSSGTPRWMLLPLQRAAARGLAFVNGPAALALAHDKAALLALLEAAGLPVVPTALVLRETDVHAALQRLDGERFVVKPLSGASGRGVVTGLPRAAAAAAAAAFADASGPVLVQPQLGAGVDRRLLVVGARVVACMERRPGAGGRANLRLGAAAAAFEPRAGEIDLALRAAALAGLDVAGVDLLDAPGPPRLLEVNASPGLRGIEAATGVDVAGAIVSLLAARLARS